MSLDVINVTTNCNICDSSELVEVFQTSNMPLTGLYLSKPSRKNELCNDQALLHCENCGHGQLKYIIDPKILYNDTYKHRSTVSAISSDGNEFFQNYLRELTGEKIFKNILEVGCNDLVLLKNIQDLGEKLVGIDPIWKNNDFSFNDKTTIVGGFIDEIDQFNEAVGRPDLIVSAHTFEHVDRTFDQFSKLVQIAADECLFLIEMPSYETLLKLGRFDQVFHQHLQYISLSSMIALVDRLDCEYVGHKYNYSYWGGTFLFSFRKMAAENRKDNPSFQKISRSQALKKFEIFKDSLVKNMDLMVQTNESIYGFGAAQMLPIIAHHLELDLSIFEGIIDDDPNRIGQYLPGISCPIVSLESVPDLSDSVCVITAIDSSRSILNRVLELKPRRIGQLFPLI